MLTRWRAATVFVSLLRIPGLFSGHISRIEMVLSFRILAGLLLIWVLLSAISHSFGRRGFFLAPRPDVEGLGGKGPVPGAQTVVFDRMPPT